MCHAQGKPFEKMGRKASGLNHNHMVGSGVADGKVVIHQVRSFLARNWFTIFSACFCWQVLNKSRNAVWINRY